VHKPTSGDIIVNGKRVSKASKIGSPPKFRQETIGFIFQKFNLIPNISTFDNIVVPIIPLNLDTKRLKRGLKNF